MTRNERDRLRRAIRRRERTSWSLRSAHAERVRRRVLRLGWRVVRLNHYRRPGTFLVVERRDDPSVFDTVDDSVEALELWLDRELAAETSRAG